MKTRMKGFPAFLVAAAVTLPLADPPVRADELSELYLGSASNNTGSEIGPNILIALDTSGSMTKQDLDFEVDPAIFWGEPYDPDRVYPGPCDATLAYRRGFNADNNDDGLVDDNDLTRHEFQSCPSAFSFPLAAVACQRVHTQGFAVDNFGEFRPYTPGPDGDYTFDGKDLDGEWESVNSSFNGVGTIDEHTVWRECATDAGIHGDSDGSYWKYPGDTGSSYGWVFLAGDAVDLSGNSRLLVASGNFINYYRWAQTRLAAVQSALREVLAELPDDTHVGVMRFDVKVQGEGSSQGGYMIKEFVRLGEGTNRQDVIDSIFAIDPADDGGTPLGETLFEALQVYRGARMVFGEAAHRWNIDTGKWPWDSNTTDYVNTASVPASTKTGYSNIYQSPIQFECQKNAIVFLSDGDPDGDKNGYQHFRDLENATDYAAEDCDDDAWPSSCMREIADYLANEDLLPNMDGDQTVSTYTVGFGDDISPEGQAFLQEVAERGQGTFTLADSYDALKEAFQIVFRTEIAENASMTSPAITVNAFNRLAHENDLYFSVFDPAFDEVRWPGNLKKYRLGKPAGSDEYVILDAKGDRVLMEDSALIDYRARSFWTNIEENNGNDGNKTLLGGAASKLDESHVMNRKVYTWLGDEANRSLTSEANNFHPTNTAITAEMLGLPDSADNNDRFTLMHWIRGVDTREWGWLFRNPWPARQAMGSTPHGVSAIVTYGGSANNPDQVIFTPTNDGLLHAINAQDGREHWAFIPTELMGTFNDQYNPPDEPYLAYGLDGSVIAHVASGDDHVIDAFDADEHAWLFFGMRKGGRAMYALDVTDKTSPEVMWRIRGGVDADFEQLGETWSEPRVARIKRTAGDTEGRLVLIFGGGYDGETQASEAASLGYVDDNVGNALYIVDAETGALLWWAGPPGSGADLELADMKSSIAANVSVKDKNEDGFADLIHAVDIGGRVFRFDIDNEAGSTFSLSVNGGKIASMGAADALSPDLANNRKFFNPPDVVLVAKGGETYWAVNIGSGDRERPKSNRDTLNYLFSIKDEAVFHSPPGGDYDYGITIGDLYDATENLIQEAPDDETRAEALAELGASKGWRVALEHTGEKALASAKTFDFRVFFTTFDPEPLDESDCNSSPGTARLYALDLVTATAVHDYNGDGVLDADDRSSTLVHNTVPPPVTFMFLFDEETGLTEATDQIGLTDDEAPLSTTNTVRRTYWNIESDDDQEQ